MFKPVEMSKVRAICLKAAAPSVTKELHKLSVLHIVDSEIPETERTGPLPSYDVVSSKLISIRSMRENRLRWETRSPDRVDCAVPVVFVAASR